MQLSNSSGIMVTIKQQIAWCHWSNSETSENTQAVPVPERKKTSDRFIFWSRGKLFFLVPDYAITSILDGLEYAC